MSEGIVKKVQEGVSHLLHPEVRQILFRFLGSLLALLWIQNVQRFESGFGTVTLFISDYLFRSQNYFPVDVGSLKSSFASAALPKLRSQSSLVDVLESTITGSTFGVLFTAGQGRQKGRESGEAFVVGGEAFVVGEG